MTLPALARVAANDPHTEVRRAATGALGLAADPAVRDALLSALRDAEWQVREEAASTLGKLKQEGAGPALTAALEDAYWQVRLQAARVLGKLGYRVALHPMGYGVQIVFSDAHERGIYPWAYLRALGAAPSA